LDYTSFRIIAERNIFNPNRSSRSGRNFTRREPERRKRVESFALVGTLSYEKGQFAFFDGASSQYRKVVEPDGAIAGYKVTEIAANHVKLEATNGAAVELRVGMEMRKQEEGNWLLATRSDTVESSAASASSDEKTDAGAEGAGNDVLRKLMQQRDQEVNKGQPASVEPAAATPETKAEPDAKAEADASTETNDVVRRLMQKREQER